MSEVAISAPTNKEAIRQELLADARANVQAALVEPHSVDVDGLADALLAIIEVLEGPGDEELLEAQG